MTVQTKGWPAGSYLLLLRASNGKESYVPMVIRSDTARGAVLIVSGVNTDEAYNGWGGYSLYGGPHRKSHDKRSLMVTSDRQRLVEVRQRMIEQVHQLEPGVAPRRRVVHHPPCDHLTQTLRSLQRDDLVSRTAYAEVPTTRPSTL